MILPSGAAGSFRDYIGSRRAVLIPVGLHGGVDLFQPVVESLGLALEEYPLAPLASPGAMDESGKEGSLAYLESLFQKNPLLLLTPTSIKINASLLQKAAGRVAAFASVSTGTDHVDLEALEREGIPFLHAPGMNARSVAEFVVASMPLLFPEDRLLEGDLSVGIVGYGRIGRRLGLYLDRMGIAHRYYDPLLAQDDGLVSPDRAASLDEVLRSDLVTFHVPLTKTGPHPTLGMVRGDYLARIPGESRVVNTSRGAIFTRESYLECCRSHDVLMDVFPMEPPGQELLHDARYVTPHVAGYNYEARAGGTRIVALELARLLGVEIPPPPLPRVEMDHNVIDFISGESECLKRDPGSFSHRRENYPPRGAFLDRLRNLPQGSPESLSPFLRRALHRLSEVE